MNASDVLRRILFLPESASTFAERVDGLHFFVLITTLVVSTLVAWTALMFFVRYRRRSTDLPTPAVVAPLWLEVTFVVVPMAFFLTWFGIGYRDFVWLTNPPPDAIDVYVMGKQWMWKFSYPEGPNAIDVLRVPVGRPVRLLMTSQDVIHSFFVPDFRIKQDVLPNRYTQTWFTATRTGRFQVLCAEYCGTDHSTMRGAVEVLSGPAYDAWRAEQQGLVARADTPNTGQGKINEVGNLALQGKQLSITLGCLRCHTTEGTPHLGPTWLDLYRRAERLTDGSTVVADEAYLTESMMDPLAKVVEGFKPIMPSYRGRLQAAETAALVEYIKSLRSDRLVRAPAQGVAP